MRRGVPAILGCRLAHFAAFFTAGVHHQRRIARGPVCAFSKALVRGSRARRNSAGSGTVKTFLHFCSLSPATAARPCNRIPQTVSPGHRAPILAHTNSESPPVCPPCANAFNCAGGRPTCYLIPTTIESGPAKCSTRLSRNPASRIQPEQSAPVKSNPPGVSISMFRLISSPNALARRSSSMIAS